MKIDKLSGVPLYIQVKAYLDEAINNEVYKPGDRIPSEAKLCKELNVSRPTVRQAVAELVSEGRLSIQKGRGTFVLFRGEIPPVDPFGPFTLTFFEQDRDWQRQYLTCSPAEELPGFLLRAYGIDPEDEDAQAAASQFWEIIWVAGVDQVPVAYCVSYIPGALYPQLAAQLEAGVPLAEIAGDGLTHIPEQVLTEVSVEVAGQDMSLDLQCSPETPLYYKETVLYAKSGDICEISMLKMRADIIKLRMAQVLN